MDSQSCKKYSDEWLLLITLGQVPFAGMYLEVALQHIPDEDGRQKLDVGLERFLQTPTGYCTEEPEMAWEEKGKNKRTSQPFKVPASEVERGLSKAWPLLAAILTENTPPFF